MLIFKNVNIICIYSNNTDTIVQTSHSFSNQKNEELYKSLTVHILNGNFINNKGLFYLHYSGLILENCNYFIYYIYYYLISFVYIFLCVRNNNTS